MTIKIKTDGCTFFPDGHWQSCCDRHDAAYARGGTRRVRLWADRQLRHCIANQGHPVLAWVAFFAVRFWGLWFWNRDHSFKQSSLINKEYNNATS